RRAEWPVFLVCGPGPYHQHKLGRGLKDGASAVVRLTCSSGVAPNDVEEGLLANLGREGPLEFLSIPRPLQTTGRRLSEQVMPIELSTPVVESFLSSSGFDSTPHGSRFMAVLDTAWGELRRIEPDVPQVVLLSLSARDYSRRGHFTMDA